MGVGGAFGGNSNSNVDESVVNDDMLIWCKTHARDNNRGVENGFTRKQNNFTWKKYCHMLIELMLVLSIISRGDNILVCDMVHCRNTIWFNPEIHLNENAVCPCSLEQHKWWFYQERVRSGNDSDSFTLWMILILKLRTFYNPLFVLVVFQLQHSTLSQWSLKIDYITQKWFTFHYNIAFHFKYKLANKNSICMIYVLLWLNKNVLNWMINI